MRLYVSFKNDFLTYSFLCTSWVVVVGVVMISRGGKAKLVHHPLSFCAFPGAATVVNKCFLESYNIIIIAAVITTFTASTEWWVVNWLVYPSCFPEPRACHSVRPYAIPILPPPSAKEVTLLLSTTTIAFCIES